MVIFSLLFDPLLPFGHGAIFAWKIRDISVKDVWVRESKCETVTIDMV